MTSYFNSLVELIQYHPDNDDNELSSYLINSLNTLQKLDDTNRKLELYIKSNEKLIQEELKKQTANKSTTELHEDWDETPFREAIAHISMCRNKRNELHEKQLQIANSCYDIIDKKINTFDETIKIITSRYPYIFPTNSDNSPDKKRRKKSNSLNPSELTIEEFNETLDEMMKKNKHEPKYCLCKRVSFGEMVACENEDCRIEWFHFQCVGLKKAPVDKWYCPLCSNNHAGTEPTSNIEEGFIDNNQIDTENNTESKE
mmetsp:Transcript_7457/g.6688  ORF Transcript_7457/g.6688 Transcript_7457/m.6688 type:complete len:258 (+) Transcript_7457:7-780(+)